MLNCDFSISILLNFNMLLELLFNHITLNKLLLEDMAYINIDYFLYVKHISEVKIWSLELSMKSESLKKQVLLKALKKDIEIALTLKDISKSELVKMFQYFSMKADALNE